MKITVRNNDINKALRVLKKKLLLEGDLREQRERQHFVSPGEKKRIAKKAGTKRWFKKLAKINENAVKADSFVPKKKVVRTT